MTVQVLMPALSPTMTEGNLAKWTVKEGDKVAPGDVLCEIETDKATMEVEAVDEGVIGKLLIDEGTEGVAVNTPIAVLLEDGESAGDISSDAAGAPAPVAAPVADNVVELPQMSVAAQPAGAAVDDRDILYAQGVIIEPPPFDEEKFMANTQGMTVREALGAAMSEEMRRDPDVFLMGEEVAEYQGAYKVSQGMLQEFGPKRVIDTPITEYGFTGMAVGAAFRGLRPIVEFMSINFAMQACDHIINSAAKTLYMAGGKMGCPIVFRGPNGAAAQVGAQHSQEYASWYAHIPGMKVVSPWSAADAKGLMKAAIRDPNPVMFLEHEMLYGQSFDVPVDEDYVIPIGRAKIERAGNDVTIVAHSVMVGRALEAAQKLAEEGIDAEVINLRSIRPLDRWTILESVKKTNRIVCVEEGWPFAGIGSEIAALVGEQAFDYLDAPLKRVCAADVPLPYAKNLERLALPQVDTIVPAVKEVCYR
ncbi:MAG: pyruvate dehydrogenase complex E1 component subunit beta [Rhodospirillales bacterium]|nr:pyruvate dehydrogenase complex E1 component subunit beta [Rhodospirillales bacterium]